MDMQLLDYCPLWLMVPLVTFLLWLGMEAGYRIGAWRHNAQADEKEQTVGAMVGSILGLVALLLAFTFSLAATRFEARRQAVLEEANAIGTTYLRARLLPAPERNEIAQLLREYTDVRLTAVKPEQTKAAVKRSEQLHEMLWQQTSSVAEKTPGSIITGLFVQSLNEVIDLHAKRILIGLHNRIPFVLWIALFGLAVLGMVSVGYQFGLSAARRSPAMFGVIIAFAIVIWLIIDLDRPVEGLLRVSQQSMLDVQQMMQSPKN